MRNQTKLPEELKVMIKELCKTNKKENEEIARKFIEKYETNPKEYGKDLAKLRNTWRGNNGK